LIKLHHVLAQTWFSWKK